VRPQPLLTINAMLLPASRGFSANSAASSEYHANK